MKPWVKTGLVIVLCLFGLFSVVAFYAIGFRPKPDGGDARASIQLGKTETRSNLSTASTTSSPENAGFGSRHVLLFADNPHPLNRRIAALLGKQLKDCPYIERLDMTNGPFFLTNGAESPDLFLNVNLVELKQSGVLSSTMKATVTASLGNAPWESSNYSRDGSTPPLVSFNWNATSESETTFTGVRTDRYADAAHSIADSFAKAISKQIEDLANKYAALPELPRDFYGPYQPVADFECLKEVQARRVGSFCGLFMHNQTYWQFRTATNPVPQLQRIISQLEAAGWKISDTQVTNTGTPFVRGRQGDAELEIFRQRANRMDLSPSVQKETSLEFTAHYRKPFSRTECEAAMEELFTEQHPIEMLLPFQNSFSPAQREKFYALLEKSPATSPRTCLQLAGICLKRKHTNDAVNMLLRAKALADTVRDASSLESDIQTVAKKISPRKELKLEITPEICRELGFLELIQTCVL